MIYDDCMLIHNYNVLFGKTDMGRRDNPIKDHDIRTLERYSSSVFSGIMNDNGSKGSMCSEEQLQAYRYSLEIPRRKGS